MTHPYEPPLFRSAIFISATLPWSADNTNGIDVTPLIVRRKSVPVDLGILKGQIEAAIADADYNPMTSDAPGIPPALINVIAELGNEPYDYNRYVTRKFHPEVDEVRIQIPTAHVLARKDPLYASGLKLVDMCDRRYASVYEHNGGHEVPRFTAEKRAIQNLIQKTLVRSEFL